jgi:hypothetical protein
MQLTPEEQQGWDAETERRRAAGVAAPEEDGRLPFTEGLNRPDRALVIADALMRRGSPGPDRGKSARRQFHPGVRRDLVSIFGVLGAGGALLWPRASAI